jgi:hypothetical protein
MARKRCAHILCRYNKLAQENGDFFNFNRRLLEVFKARFDAQKSSGASSGASFCKVRRAGRLSRRSLSFCRCLLGCPFQFNLHFHRLAVTVIDLRNVHCERSEPSDALCGPTLISVRDFLKESDQERIEIEPARSITVTAAFFSRRVLLHFFAAHGQPLLYPAYQRFLKEAKQPRCSRRAVCRSLQSLPWS